MPMRLDNALVGHDIMAVGSWDGWIASAANPTWEPIAFPQEPFRQ